MTELQQSSIDLNNFRINRRMKKKNEKITANDVRFQHVSLKLGYILQTFIKNRYRIDLVTSAEMLMILT